MKKIIAAAALSIAAPGASADEFDTMMLASDLGGVLASEEICGLSFDHERIVAFIDENAAASDLGFANQLNMQTRGQARMFQDQSPSARAAHCASTTATARRFGFIE